MWFKVQTTPPFHIQAAEFQSFWGKKSELRRFEDGSINKAVVWGRQGEEMETRKLISLNIVCHLLQRSECKE